MRKGDYIYIIYRKWNFEPFKYALGTDNVKYIHEMDLEGKRDDSQKQLDGKEVESIIMGCRLLRNLNYEEARQKINYVADQWINLMNIERPKLVISVTVDNYILDVIARICEKNNIKYLGLVNSPIPGYSRLTTRGKLEQGLWGPARTEIMDFYRNRRKPSHYEEIKFKVKLKKRIVNYAREKYFKIKHLFGANDYHTIVNSNWGSIDKGYLNGSINVEVKEKYFIPLQFTPECTVDYWSPVYPNNDYEQFICDLISNNKSIRFVLKEHPSYMGYRKKSFIEWINKQENCEVISVMADNYDLISKCKAVCTLTGTVGIETVMTGGTLIILGDIPYYLDGCNSSIHILGNEFHPSDEIKERVVENISKSLIRGGLKFEKKIYGWRYNENLAIDLSKSLNKYIEIYNEENKS